MEMQSIRLVKGKERALQRRHPWIFSGAIHPKSPLCTEGDIVRVESSTGEFLAIGHYMAPNASIRIKILTYTDEILNEGWWASRLANAFNLRKSLGLIGNSSTTAYRLVYGEGDLLPGLIIDIYGSNAVIQCHTKGMHCELPVISCELDKLFEGQLSTIFDKSGDVLHDDTENQYLKGSDTFAQVLENNVHFKVDWSTGQKTGFFIDQRDNRDWVGQFSKGKKVLNAFAYTGGFSMYALLSGAREVHSVDLSETACQLATENAELNGVADRHTAIASDVQQFLKTMDDDYDIVILDPPAFAKRRKAVHNAIQAYKRLNATAMKRMKPGSLLFTFSCSQNVSAQAFTDTLRAASIEVGRPVRILRELRQPFDHPENIYFPEGHYLKGLLLEIG